MASTPQRGPSLRDLFLNPLTSRATTAVANTTTTTALAPAVATDFRATEAPQRTQAQIVAHAAYSMVADARNNQTSVLSLLDTGSADSSISGVTDAKAGNAAVAATASSSSGGGGTSATA